MKFNLISDKNRKVEINMDRINIYTSKWKPGTPFEFEIVRRVSKKSDPQRAYYFSAVIKDYAEHIGYDVDERYLFHCFLKFRYFTHYYKYVEPDKSKIPYLDKNGIMRNLPSVFADDSEFDVDFKARFIDWVIRRAAYDGCYIPDSNR